MFRNQKQLYSLHMRRMLIKILILTMLVLGAVIFIRPSVHAAPADTVLPIPYSRQYQGQATQLVDCGPTSVAMVLEYFYGSPVNEVPPLSGDFITQVRNATGNTSAADTNFSDLENALTVYGLPYSEISNSLSPQPTAQIQAIEQAISAGNPVIALIHGADLGRGQQYGDHWVVVTGFSSDGQTVYLNDPDPQVPRWSGWIQGGQITLPLSVFQQAAYDAPSGPYGIVVSPPMWDF